MAKIANNSVTVSSSGTRVAFTTAPTPLKSILIHANSGNSGNVYVGDSSVTTSNCPPIAAGKTLELKFRESADETAGDLMDFYVDADNNGNGITYLVVQLS